MRVSQGVSQEVPVLAPAGMVAPMMPHEVSLGMDAFDDWWFSPDLALQDAHWDQPLNLKDSAVAPLAQCAGPLGRSVPSLPGV